MIPLPETPAHVRVMVRQLLRERLNWRKRLKRSKRYTDLYRTIKHELAVAGREVGDHELERYLMTYYNRPTEDQALDDVPEPEVEELEQLDENPEMPAELQGIVEEVLEEHPEVWGGSEPAPVQAEEKPTKTRRGGRRKPVRAKTVALSDPAVAAHAQAAEAPPVPPVPAIQTTAGPGELAIFRMTIETNLPGFEELVSALAARIGVKMY